MNRRLVVLQTACLLLAVLSILVGFGHFAQYPLLDISEGLFDSFGQWINGTSVEGDYTDAKIAQLNLTSLDTAKPYVKAIMDPEDSTFSRVECHAPIPGRYDYLRGDNSTGASVQPRYFFALDLHQSAEVLPRLLGSVIESIRFLGEEHCALSIVEGRSQDPTFEVLVLLKDELERNGIRYFLKSSDINPLAEGSDRVDGLAQLRNMALEPLMRFPHEYANDTTVVFLNDVAICMEDILELVHQLVAQEAHMMCAMDWTYVGPNPTFYDVWISRTLKGDTFFNIPLDGSWDSAWNLFWNDPGTRGRMRTHKPFQVFACWNGAAVFLAETLKQVQFRGHHGDECYQGEPQLFCKDLWMAGFSRIGVVPSVNLEYSDEAAKKLKALKGHTSDWADVDDASQKIEWDPNPPEQVKCMASFQNQYWVPWDE